MKKIYNYSLIICVVAGMLSTMTSCQGFLDRTPIDESSAQSFFKTEQDVRSWIAGTYKGVNEALNGEIVWWGDARTDNVYPTVYGGGENFQFNNITSSNGHADWNGIYTVIARCNLGIEKISAMSIGEAVKASALGQLYGLRALMYFYIVRLWGPAPLIDKSWDGNPATKYVARSSVAEIETKVIEPDIEKAISLLGNEGVYYFNLGAVMALKIDYLAYKGRYSELLSAYQMFSIIGGATTPRYKLITAVNDWNKIFTTPAASTETIFSMAWSSINYTGASDFRSSYAGTIGYSGSNGAFVVASSYWNLMIRDKSPYAAGNELPNDIRSWGVLAMSYGASATVNHNLSFPIDAANAPTYAAGATSGPPNINIQSICKYWPIGTAKGTFTESNTNIRFEPSIYRLADVMLLYAEALNRTGDSQGAIDVVNKIRVSRGCTLVAQTADYPDQLGRGTTSVERLIMDERQLELYMEGKRWFDLRRTSWCMDVLNEHVRYIQYGKGVPVTGFTDPNRLWLPVSQNALTSNPKLTQNPSY